MTNARFRIQNISIFRPDEYDTSDPVRWSVKAVLFWSHQGVENERVRCCSYNSDDNDGAGKVEIGDDDDVTVFLPVVCVTSTCAVVMTADRCDVIELVRDRSLQPMLYVAHTTELKSITPTINFKCGQKWTSRQLHIIVLTLCAYLVWPCLEVNPHDKA